MAVAAVHQLPQIVVVVVIKAQAQAQQAWLSLDI
jgi:hypothetical protein